MLNCKSLQTSLSEGRFPAFTVYPLDYIIMQLQSAGTAQSSVNVSPKKQRHNSFVHCTHSRHLQSTVLVENYIFNDNKTVHTHYHFTASLLRGSRVTTQSPVPFFLYTVAIPL